MRDLSSNEGKGQPSSRGQAETDKEEFKTWLQTWKEYKNEMILHENLLKYDLKNFIKIHGEMSPREIAAAFSYKWPGHRQVFGEAYILFLMENVNRPAIFQGFKIRS